MVFRLCPEEIRANPLQGFTHTLLRHAATHRLEIFWHIHQKVERYLIDQLAQISFHISVEIVLMDSNEPLDGHHDPGLDVVVSGLSFTGFLFLRNQKQHV